jgi:DNA ligase-1
MLNLQDINLLVYKLESVTKLKIKQDILTEFFKPLTNQEIKYFLMCLDPKHKLKKKIGFSNQSLIKIIINQKYQNSQDLFYKEFGYTKSINPIKIWKEFSRKEFSESKNILELKQLWKFYQDLSNISGKNSSKSKLNLISQSLKNHTPESGYLIVSFLTNQTRFGFGMDLVFRTLGHIKELDPKIIKHNYLQFINLQDSKDMNFSNSYNIKLGVPFRPMLCKIFSDSIYSKVSKNQTYVYEKKYDGIRLQIHITKENIFIFSRNLENLTNSLKTYLNYLTKIKQNIVLDCELVGLNFQEIIQIFRRKHLLQNFKNKKVELKYFDILYMDDHDIINLPYLERKSILKSVLDKYSLKGIVQYYQINQNTNLNQIVNDLYKIGYQGIILKNINSNYKIDIRDNNWIKVKPEFQTGDFIVIGCIRGHGLKSEYYSSFLLGVLDQNNKIKEIGYVGSGFKIEILKELKKLLQPLIVYQDTHYLKLKPDLVFEIKFQGLQDSKVYTSKYSLRFPVFKRYRPDKKIQDSTKLKQVLQINEFFKK